MTYKVNSTHVRGNDGRVIPLRYREDPTQIYARIEGLGQAALLDSGGDAIRGRWDIVCASAHPTRSLSLPREAADLPTAELREKVACWATVAAQHCTGEQKQFAEDLPFRGGYLGHLSYELGRRLQGFEAAENLTLPLAIVHYYPWAVVQDRRRKTAFLVNDGTVSQEVLTALVNRLNAPGEIAQHSRPNESVASVESSALREGELQPAKNRKGASTNTLLERFAKTWTIDDYKIVFNKVKDYIRAGDCYQINIGQPFLARSSGDLLGEYRALRTVAGAPYSAFLPLGDSQALLCFSPERFLAVNDRQVTSSPIKGTRPRDTDPRVDRASALDLLNSEKERAENLMIVDLLRNDIGRYCKPGTVKADTLFELQSYRTVHHLVSTVSGELAPGINPLTLLLGCMPGGSITGAPKHRAMQIIDELEPAARQSWCGSVFYFSHHGRFDSNIAIRTLLSEGEKLHCWAGGGLVDDSQLLAEYAEQEHKVGALLRALDLSD